MPFFISRKEFEAVVSKRVIEACDQIAREMGADLHDGIRHYQYVMDLYLHRIDQSAYDPKEVRALVLKSQVEQEKATRVVENALSRLMPRRKEGQTMVNMLQALCQEMEHPGVAHIHFSSDGVPVPLRAPVVIHILKIVQELIQNAFRHSSAWHIWVRLQWQPEMFTVEVEDDGKGFNHVHEFIARLKEKNNTLRLRAEAIRATIDYVKLEKGLIAKLQLYFNNSADGSLANESIGNRSV